MANKNYKRPPGRHARRRNFLKNLNKKKLSGTNQQPSSSSEIRQGVGQDKNYPGHGHGHGPVPSRLIKVCDYEKRLALLEMKLVKVVQWVKQNLGVDIPQEIFTNCDIEFEESFAAGSFGNYNEDMSQENKEDEGVDDFNDSEEMEGDGPPAAESEPKDPLDFDVDISNTINQKEKTTVIKLMGLSKEQILQHYTSPRDTASLSQSSNPVQVPSNNLKKVLVFTKAEYQKYLMNKNYSSRDSLLKDLKRVNQVERKTKVPERKIEPEMISCSLCHVKYANENGLESHLLNFHNITNTSNTISKISTNHISKFTTNLNKSLKLQKLSEFNQDDEGQQQHHCPKCPGKFTTKSGLLLHKTKMHPDPEKELLKTFICTKGNCGLKYETYPKLRRHILKYHLSQSPCEICGKSYPVSGMKLHMSTHNSEKIPCPESHCHKIFNNQVNLQKHLKNAHVEPSEYATCSVEGCLKKFKSIKYLKRHLQIHDAQSSGERKFCCQICGKTFATKNCYSAHKRMAHAKEVDHEFKCTFEGCNVGYSTRKYFEEHLKTHDPNYQPGAQLKENICHICAKEYATMPQLRRHIEKVHENGNDN